MDDKLIKDIAKGSMEALHTLYEKTHKSVYAFALSITKNTHDAEDILQDTFLKIYQKAADYTSYDKPMAWIFTIARNFALMKIRDGKKEGSLEDDNERTILLLHAVAGLKNREIAELLDMSINTVLSKYNRTVRKMQKYLEEEGF